MQPLPLHLATSVLAISCALLPGPAGAESADAAVEEEPFEVVVIRGGSVSLVTGTPNGVIREETLREGSRPARHEDTQPARREDPPRVPAPVPTARDQITIVLYGEPGYSLLLYPPSAQHRFYPQGHKRHRQVFASHKPKQRFHRAHTHPAHGSRWR